MPGLDQWGEEYIRLAFRIHQHIDGYVDAYNGSNGAPAPSG